MEMNSIILNLLAIAPKLLLNYDCHAAHAYNTA